MAPMGGATRGAATMKNKTMAAGQSTTSGDMGRTGMPTLARTASNLNPNNTAITRTTKGKPPMNDRTYRRLQQHHKTLLPLQNEKIDGLRARIDEMDECFEIQRQNRLKLKKLYEERREEVKRLINVLRDDITENFKRLHKDLKAFSVDFLGNVEDARQEWLETLQEREDEIVAFLDELENQKTVRVKADIAKEKREMEDQIAREAKNIRDKLAAIDSDLVATGAERVKHQAIYDNSFVTKFERLFRVLQAESRARALQCAAAKEENAEVYRRLHLREDQIERDVRNIWKDLTYDVRAEEKERIGDQEWLVDENRSFLDQLKENMEEDIRNQHRINAERRKKMAECTIGLK